MAVQSMSVQRLPPLLLQAQAFKGDQRLTWARLRLGWVLSRP